MPSTRSYRHKLRGDSHRRADIETLEERAMLSSGGVGSVGSQPIGALTGKIVYVHAGHGWTHSGGSWGTQRPELFEMVEDFGNQDQMNFLVDYLFHAGATVVPLRPAGHQPNEVVLDNDDAAVSFVGNWSDSSSSVYFGNVGDVAYRFTEATVTETSYARYRPSIPEAGFYPVYSWVRSGANRLPNQLYRISHSGGVTEVTLNHQQVGNGWVYLGSYYFSTGDGGYVDVSNRSDRAGVVIADAIRFGNGMGDVDPGGVTSGAPREDEAGLYWIQSQFGQGTPVAGITGTVSGPPRWAAQMNRETAGSMTDRVFLSFHSNAGGGGSRGTMALYNGNNNAATATPNQSSYADLIAREVNDDLVALNGTFEHSWFDRNNVTLDRSDIEFGEINNLYINNEFDATILEVGFHDNQLDAELMRDPKVRDVVARATYQGIVRYFHQFDAGATPVAFLPDPPSRVRTTVNDDGSVSVAWQPADVDGIGGHAATAYRIYQSSDGYGFDGGILVPGGATRSHTITDLDPEQGSHYFRVVAVNAGGESKPSPTVVARIAEGSLSPVLIVDGFDRLGRAQNMRMPFAGGSVDRVRTRHGNSRDYTIQVAEALEAFPRTVGVDTAANESISSGEVNLGNYDTVVWILGEESSADSTFDIGEQFVVSNFIAQGGNLFVSGAEIGWDLDRLNHGRIFYNETLKADYVRDDAGTYSVQGVADSIFAGLAFQFDDGSELYNAEYPDVLSPLGGSRLALNYIGGFGGGAAIQYDGAGQAGSVVMLGFPFETITSATSRAEIMRRTLDFFETVPVTIPQVLGFERNDGTERFDLMNSLAFTFDQEVSPALSLAELSITEQASGRILDLSRATTAATSVPNQVRIDLTDVPVQPGLYTISLSIVGVANAAFGNSSSISNDGLAGDFSITERVTVLGDVNLDGSVDAADASAMLASWGPGPATWQRGDWNFDGLTDAADAATLFANWSGDSIPEIQPIASDADAPPFKPLALDVDSTFMARPNKDRWVDDNFTFGDPDALAPFA